MNRFLFSIVLTSNSTMELNMQISLISIKCNFIKKLSVQQKVVTRAGSKSTCYVKASSCRSHDMGGGGQSHIQIVKWLMNV